MSAIVLAGLAAAASPAAAAEVDVVPALPPQAEAFQVAPPVFTTVPPATSRTTLPVFAWTSDAPSFDWAISDSSMADVHTGTGPETSVAPPQPLTDGTYAFTVWALDPVSQKRGASAAHEFTVDTLPPPPPRIISRPTFPTTVTTPTFGVAGIEPGATASWQVVAAGGSPVQGPEPVSASTLTLAALAPGSYVLQIRQSDPAGNTSAAFEPFAIVPPPAIPAATPTPTRLVLPRANTKRLKPRPGARIATVRPVLKWTRGPKGTTLYNVQVFRVGAPTAENAATVKLTKLRSVFPRTRQVRMPGLKRGQCYVWRVWPYVGSRFTAKPLGVSNFCVAAPRRAARR